MPQSNELLTNELLVGHSKMEEQDAALNNNEKIYDNLGSINEIP